MRKYVPKVGDSVIATRRTFSDIDHNFVIGPVTSVTEDHVLITTNKGTRAEGNFELDRSKWKFTEVDGGQNEHLRSQTKET